MNERTGKLRGNLRQLFLCGNLDMIKNVIFDSVKREALKMNKKIFAMLLGVICTMNSHIVFAAQNTEVTEGSYIQLGRYMGEPIIWRCISTDDENGTLMVSDKILCFKAANAGENRTDGTQSELYGSNFWEESTIRIWLNSTETAGDVKWTKYPPDKEHLGINGFDGNYPYADEAGFLSSENFTPAELAILKSISQWVALPADKIDLKTNGHKEPFITEWYTTKNLGETQTAGQSGISDFPDAYKGAMYRINDTMFLLNEQQLKKVYDVYGTAGTESTYEPPENSLAASSYRNSYYGNFYPYLLISPYNNINETSNNICFNTVYYGAVINKCSTSAENGIRPAFYLNEKTAYIKSGSGTKDDPYVLDGTAQDGIAVFANGEQVDFAQPPVVENDRTLVGMRAVFEALGAEIQWNGETQTVTAKKDDRTIILQIGSNVMLVNDTSVELDAPAELINDNTMVPLRAVSEALNAKVNWIEGLQRVVIDVQPEWIEYDWNPEWYQEALRVGGYIE